MCYPTLFKIEVSKKLTGSNIISSTILSDGIAIIGLAVAVWAGLNIANLIEKREVDKLQYRVQEINEEIKEREKQQNQVDKDKFLHEMYAIANDEATNELITMFSKLSADAAIPYLRLLDIEQKFRSVYELHESKFDKNDHLCKIAKDGISFAKDILVGIKEPVTKLYLDFRIAEFHFYMGYCCLGKERSEHFKTAIEIYTRVADDFNADIPNYIPAESYADIHHRPCKKISAVSAYFCNTIGEAYSKIEQEKKRLKEEGVSEDEIKIYGLKAVFYCSYANHFGSKSVYKRNLGCAIERMYSTISHYEELKELYEDALILDYKNVNNFKTLASLYDKYVNYILHIEPVILPQKRNPTLCDKQFAYLIKNLYADPNKSFPAILAVLEDLHRIAKQAKTVHFSQSVGYQYECIYYRDMCTIFGNHILETDHNIIAEMRDKARIYLDKAEENWDILHIIAPYDPEDPLENPMTQILRNDLDDLKTLL